MGVGQLRVKGGYKHGSGVVFFQSGIESHRRRPTADKADKAKGEGQTSQVDCTFEIDLTLHSLMIDGSMETRLALR